jgi:cytidylate kinase
MSGSAGSSANFVVTIDGPAGAGKSTVARQLAAHLGYGFLDTGAIYRSVALLARERGVAWSDGPTLGALAAGLEVRFEGGNRVVVDGADVSAAIRTPEISEGASRVSALPEVRGALLSLQRSVGSRGRVVAEGRDTGTVVFPGAPAKFYLTAAPAERARRRALELAAAGKPADVAQVLREMQLRDERDSTRSVSPLRKASDAVEIDTSALTPAEVVAQMAAIVRARGG